jgi:hypothetical protein
MALPYVRTDATKKSLEGFPLSTEYSSIGILNNFLKDSEFGRTTLTPSNSSKVPKDSISSVE